MDYRQFQFEQWIDQIYRTAEQEIGCDVLQEFLPAYTDFVVQRAGPELPLGEIKLHLVQCLDCAEVYQGLRRVAELEARGALPGVAELMADLAPEPALPVAEREAPYPAPKRAKALPLEAAPLDLFPTNPG